MDRLEDGTGKAKHSIAVSKQEIRVEITRSARGWEQMSANVGFRATFVYSAVYHSYCSSCSSNYSAGNTRCRGLSLSCRVAIPHQSHPLHLVRMVAGWLAGSWDNAISFIDAATGRELRTLSGRADRVATLAFSQDGRWAPSRERR